MATSLPPTARRPRLNPFAFVSDTTFRFVLLIVSVASSSLFLFFGMYATLDITKVQRDRDASRVEQCLIEAEVLLPPGKEPFFIPRTPAEIDAANAYIQAGNRCFHESKRSQALWMLGGLALLFATAGAIYWAYPTLKMRQSRLVRLRREDMPEVVDYLSELCKEAGLARPPTFVWNALSPSASGVAFGHLGRYSVALSGGLVMQFYSDRPAFRAVVLHELAHLRNGDVDKAYFSVALSQAFVIVAIIPYALSVNPFLQVSRITELLFLAALTYLSRNSILRAREVYADVRASTSDGPTGALDRVLACLQRPKRPGWWKLLSMHPNPDDRRQSLVRTDRLFKLGIWEALASGALIAVSVPQLAFLESVLTPLIFPQSWTYLAVSAVLAPIMMGIVGLGVWRATFVALMRGERPRGAGRLGLGLGLGIILVQHLSPSSIDYFARQPSVFPLAFEIVWSVTLLGSLFCLFRWLQSAAAAWLSVSIYRNSSRKVYLVGLAIAALVMVMWLGFLLNVRQLVQTSWSVLLAELPFGAEGPALVLLLVLRSVILLLGLVSLWALPLAAAGSRSRGTASAVADWTLLDAQTPLPALPLPLDPFRMRLALTHGVYAGALFCVLLLAIRILVRLVVPEVVLSSEAVRTAYYFSQVALGAIVQATVAGIVVGRVKLLGTIHGLFAAFVAGCLVTVGILALSLAFGGGFSGWLVWTTFSTVVNGGAMLALMLSGAIAIVVRLIGSGGMQPPQPPALLSRGAGG